MLNRLMTFCINYTRKGGYLFFIYGAEKQTLLDVMNHCTGQQVLGRVAALLQHLQYLYNFQVGSPKWTSLDKNCEHGLHESNDFLKRNLFGFRLTFVMTRMKALSYLPIYFPQVNVLCSTSHDHQINLVRKFT